MATETERALSDAEVRTLADIFGTRPSAARLLDEIGLRSARLPSFDGGSADDFWFAVSRELALGVIADGRARLLAVALREYPANPVFVAALRSGGTPPGDASAPASSPPDPSGAHARRMPEAGSERLAYRATDGATGTVALAAGPGEPRTRPAAGPGPVAVGKAATDLATGRPLRMYLLPRERMPAGRAALGNEIRIGTELVRVFGGAYPPELARLVGHSPEPDGDDEPFVLFDENDLAVSVAAGGVRSDRLHAFQASLFRALSILSTARVVHLGITPHSVRWDGERVQLVDFSLARMAGEQHGPVPASVWSAPETRGNRYAADAAADLYSAGLVAVQTARGPGADPGTALGPLAADPENPMAPHLSGLFEPDPDDRPPLSLVMSDLGALDDHTR